MLTDTYRIVDIVCLLRKAVITSLLCSAIELLHTPNVQVSCYPSPRIPLGVWPPRGWIHCAPKKDDALPSVLELIGEDNGTSDLPSSFIESLLSRLIEPVGVLAFHSFFNFFMLCLSSCSAATTVFWSGSKTKPRCTICPSSGTHMRGNRGSFSNSFSSGCTSIPGTVKSSRTCHCQSSKSSVILASNILLLCCASFQTAAASWKSASISLRKASLPPIKLRRARILLEVSCTICLIADFTFSGLYIDNKRARVRDSCLESASNCWAKISLTASPRLLDPKM